MMKDVILTHLEDARVTALASQIALNAQLVIFAPCQVDLTNVRTINVLIDISIAL
jgi:hypothetical protein